jgi:transcriptional regulator of NAD metabolism
MEREEWADLDKVLTAEEYAMFMEELRRRHAKEVEEGVGGLVKRWTLEAEEEVTSREERSWVRRVVGWVWTGKE